ncbi:MAG TPA: hypothetical protein PLP07_04535 [Pyrinomonadaceae bacterium]|nr:hypothetical protein [Chloracidobacterium sp.]MBP9934800.1 hypothetical protein [Pyrinomonadaceae bacterium]MBK7803170.1 hypothetical protein [Chloracidobacterium sp.]MBK9438182.1 hypothetical protein [Chloracidobacterium sp.]MBL0240941.1 hypothetical protein [Chloracidobacterium sp.]
MKVIILIIMLLGSSVLGQKSVDDLRPKHAAELQNYLATHDGEGFLQEYAIDDKTLVEMRDYFGKSFKPYYLTGDFNRDRIQDFALLLTRSGKPVFATTEDAESRKDDQNLMLVVFNGSAKGSFTVAHREKIEAPLSCFIRMTDGKRPKLYFGVYESDADTFILASAGSGYIVEYDKSP